MKCLKMVANKYGWSRVTRVDSFLIKLMRNILLEGKLILQSNNLCENVLAKASVPIIIIFLLRTLWELRLLWEVRTLWELRIR